MSEAILAKYLRDIADVLGDIRNSLNNVHTDVNWSAAQEAVISGEAISMFPVGTQLVVDHSGIYGSHIYDVVDHNAFGLYNGSPTMTLMAHQAYVREEFGTQNAIFEGTLEAGSYFFYVNEALDAWEKGFYKFTIYSSGGYTGRFYLSDEFGRVLHSTSPLSGARISVISETVNGVNRVVNVATISSRYDVAPSDEAEYLFATGTKHVEHWDTVRRGGATYAYSEIRQFLTCNPKSWEFLDASLSLPPSWESTDGNSFYGTLPSALKSVMVPMPIIHEDETFEDNVTIATQMQIFGSGDITDGTSQFEYFKLNPASNIKVKYNAGAKSKWGLRSQRSYATEFIVDTDGSLGFAGASTKIGFAPVITIGKPTKVEG